MLGNPYVIGITKQFFHYFGIDSPQVIGILLVLGMFLTIIVVAVVGMWLCGIFVDGKIIEDSEYDD